MNIEAAHAIVSSAFLVRYVRDGMRADGDGYAVSTPRVVRGANASLLQQLQSPRRVKYMRQLLLGAAQAM